MINIAYLIDTISTDTAGTQKQLLQLIQKLDRKRYHPFLICLKESKWMQENPIPCKHISLAYNGFISLSFPLVVRRLIKFLTAKNICIVQTFFEDSIFVGLIGANLAKFKPLLLSSRRDMGLGLQGQPWYHRLYLPALLLVNRFFDGIITNSFEIQKFVSKRERVPLNKIKVIYNGIEIPQKKYIIPDLFRRYKADVWIGIVASLTPVKRHDIILKAFSQMILWTSGSTIRLVIIGDGEKRKTLSEMAIVLGIKDHVHFEGAVKNVLDYLNMIDIGVLCSDREGLSNSILEYMACGLPVVATRVGGNTELVNNKTGICVPPGDSRALAIALLNWVRF